MSMNIPERENKRACAVKADQRQDVSITAMLAASILKNPPVPQYQDRTSVPNPGIETLVTLGELRTTINNQLSKMGHSNLKDVPLNELENKLLTAIEKNELEIHTKKTNGDPPRGSSEQGGEKKAPVKEKNSDEKSKTTKSDS